MVKIVTLMKRRSGLSGGDFQKHLRAKYGPRAAKGPGLRRYVQSCALVQGYTNIRENFSSMRSAKCGSIRWKLPVIAFARAREDESAFLDPSRTVVMPVDVYVIKDGAIPDNAVKNIEFVNRRRGMPLTSFRAYWRNVHGPLAATIPVLRRYEQNHLAMAEYEKNETPPFDGLAITWFASTADMRRGTTTPEYAATRADEPHFLQDGHLPIIITREHLVV